MLAAVLFLFRFLSGSPFPLEYTKTDEVECKQIYSFGFQGNVLISDSITLLRWKEELIYFWAIQYCCWFYEQAAYIAAGMTRY